MQLCVCCLFVLLLAVVAEARKGPSAPRKVSAKVVSPYSVEVKWRDPDLRNRGRAKTTRVYIIKYVRVGHQNSGNDTDYKTAKSRGKRVKLFGLSPGTTYEIEVKAVKGKSSSPWSKAAIATTDAERRNADTVRNLTATPTSSESILLSWLTPANGNQVVAYTVLSQLANGKGRQRKAVVTNKMLQYEVINLRPALKYRFMVQTMQKIGPHPLSPAVSASPYSDVPSRAPRQMKLKLVNSTLVIVKWQPPAPRSRNGQLVGYTLQYKRKGSRKGDVCTITTDRGVRLYNLTDILGNETYKVRVAASTVNGTGTFTKWESIFIVPDNDSVVVTRKYKHGDPRYPFSDGATPDLSPSPPSEVKVVNKSGSNVHLVWPVPMTPECCPVVAYRLAIRNLNDSTASEMVRGTSRAHLIGLSPDSWYGVNVTTLNTAGESDPSEEFIFKSLKAEAPRITYYHAKAVLIGGNANFTCKAEGYEVPSLEWFAHALGGAEGRAGTLVKVNEGKTKFGGTVIVTSRQRAHDTVTSSLLVYRVTPEAERKFVCSVRNSAGVHKKALMLEIYEPPKIRASRGKSVMVNTSAALFCSVTGKPLPAVEWVHNATEKVYREIKMDTKDPPPVLATSIIAEEIHNRQSVLVFERTSLEHAGHYTCMARSKSGAASVTVLLEVKVPPVPAISKIQTLALSPTRVSVNWLPPLNYSYPIRYYQVSYRRQNGGRPVVFNTTRIGTELSNLEPSATYLVGVTAGTNEGLGEAGPEVEVTTLTNESLQPANVSAKVLNSSIIQLDWESPATVSPMYIRGYNVYYRREGEEGREEQLFVPGSRNKQFLIGLGSDVTYYLRISTLTTWDYEAHSAWIRIQKQSKAYRPPTKPMNVKAVATYREITLSWDPPASSQEQFQPAGVHVEGYKIAYGPVDSPYNVSRTTVSSNTTNLTMISLQPATNYMISIRAFNDIGDGEPIYVRSATQVYPPSMVQDAQARAVSSTEIHVHWEAPIRGHVTRYHIRYWRPGRKDKQSAWMTGNFRNYVAGSLRKNSMYRFEIIPYSKDIPGEGIVIFSHTLGDKPEGPPQDITLRRVNSTTLLARWSPPDPDRANGDVTGFRLILRVKGGGRAANFRLAGTERNFTFYNMEISENYKLRIAAMTVNGTGVFSPWIESTYSSNPDKPDPPENLSVRATETSLTLYWTPPKFSGWPIHGYIVGYGQFIPDVYREILDKSTLSYAIQSLKPGSEYIISVRAYNHIGESQPTFRIARTAQESILATPLLPPVKLAVQSESATSLTLSWVDPALIGNPELADGRAYMIRFSPLSGEAYSYINTTDLHLSLSDLEPATSYEVSVKIVRGNKSSSWSLPVVNSTHQTAPSSAPENITATALPDYPNYVYLKWSAPSSPNGKIIEYIVYTTSDPTLPTKLWVVVPTFRQEIKIRDLSPHTTYYFKVQARNEAGYGPLSETVVYKPPTEFRAIPFNVTVTGLYGNMSTTVRVAWRVSQAALADITGYMIYYTDDISGHGHWLIQKERGLDTVVMALDSNTTYYFKVQARYGPALGPFSETVAYTTYEYDARTAEVTESEPVEHELVEANNDTDEDNEKDDGRSSGQKEGEVDDVQSVKTAAVKAVDTADENDGMSISRDENFNSDSDVFDGEDGKESSANETDNTINDNDNDIEVNDRVTVTNSDLDGDVDDVNDDDVDDDDGDDDDDDKDDGVDRDNDSENRHDDDESGDEDDLNKAQNITSSEETEERVMNSLNESKLSDINRHDNVGNDTKDVQSEDDDINHGEETKSHDKHANRTEITDDEEGNGEFRTKTITELQRNSTGGAGGESVDGYSEENDGSDDGNDDDDVRDVNNFDEDGLRDEEDGIAE